MAKICIVCGEDCSTRPRVKNPKGEYVCKACLESKKGNASKGPAPVASGAFGVQALPDELLQDLPDPSAEDACSSCGRKLPEDAVICTSCGVNLRTGKVLRTKTVAVKEPSALGGAAATTGMAVALPVLWVIGGSIGGAIGAGVWAAVAYFLNFEIAWIAVGVGGLTGAGVAFASGFRTNYLSGGIAVLIACAALLGGKYAAFHFAVESAFSEASLDPQDITDEDAIEWIGYETADLWIADGRTVTFADGSDLESAEWPDEYPQDIQDEASRIWNGLDRSERQQERIRIARTNEANLSQFKQAVTEEAFMDHFDMIDLLFFLVAIAVAFQVGSMGSTEE